MHGFNLQRKFEGSSTCRSGLAFLLHVWQFGWSTWRDMNNLHGWKTREHTLFQRVRSKLTWSGQCRPGFRLCILHILGRLFGVIRIISQYVFRNLNEPPRYYSLIYQGKLEIWLYLRYVSWMDNSTKCRADATNNLRVHVSGFKDCVKDKCMHYFR